MSTLVKLNTEKISVEFGWELVKYGRGIKAKSNIKKINKKRRSNVSKINRNQLSNTAELSNKIDVKGMAEKELEKEKIHAKRMKQEEISNRLVNKSISYKMALINSPTNAIKPSFLPSETPSLPTIPSLISTSKRILTKLSLLLIFPSNINKYPTAMADPTTAPTKSSSIIEPSTIILSTPSTEILLTNPSIVNNSALTPTNAEPSTAIILLPTNAAESPTTIEPTNNYGDFESSNQDIGILNADRKVEVEKEPQYLSSSTIILVEPTSTTESPSSLLIFPSNIDNLSTITADSTTAAEPSPANCYISFTQLFILSLTNSVMPLNFDAWWHWRRQRGGIGEPEHRKRWRNIGVTFRGGNQYRAQSAVKEQQCNSIKMSKGSVKHAKMIQRQLAARRYPHCWISGSQKTGKRRRQRSRGAWGRAG